MTTLHETAYPQLKIDPTPRELSELYSPTLDEMVFVSSISKRPLPRIALLIHLKIFQRLGYFVRLGDVPAIIREHIVQQTDVLKAPLLADLRRFEGSGMRMPLITALREYLNIRTLDASGYTWLDQVSDTAAETKHAVADIINVMLEELVHHRYELPAFSTLDRMAFRAREKSNNHYFTSISKQLTPQTKAMIDNLLWS